MSVVSDILYLLHTVKFNCVEFGKRKRPTACI